MAKPAENGAVPPVLLLVWRRPDSTRKLIDALRPSRPERVFVSGDGPKGDEDEADVRRVRDVIDEAIDWDCELITRFNPVNLGCEQGVTSGIDWFFSFVDHGVVLEDDLVPHPDFLRLSGELLERYRDDERVWAICGHNESALGSDEQGSVAGFPEGSSYAFLPYFHPWGWATWRDRWARYDRDLKLWREQRISADFERWCLDVDEEYTWRWIFGDVLARADGDAWDWKWVQTIMLSGGLVVIPRVNLVANTGFGPDAMHTVTATQQQRRPAAGLGLVRHPDQVSVDAGFRRQYFESVYSWFVKKARVGVLIGVQKMLSPHIRRQLRVAVRRVRR